MNWGGRGEVDIDGGCGMMRGASLTVVLGSGGGRERLGFEGGIGIGAGVGGGGLDFDGGFGLGSS